jgi:predicted transcriptional regulator
MAAADKITVSLDASIVAQAREQLGEPAAGLADDAVIERAINAYLLRRMVDTTQLAAGLSEKEAERVAYDELSAARQERRASA